MAGIFRSITDVIESTFKDRLYIIEKFLAHQSAKEDPDMLKALFESLGWEYHTALSYEQNLSLLERLVMWMRGRGTARAVESMVRASFLESQPVVYEPFSDVFITSRSALSSTKHFTDADYYRPGTYDVIVRAIDSFIQHYIFEDIPVGMKGYITFFMPCEEYDDLEAGEAENDSEFNYLYASVYADFYYEHWTQSLETSVMELSGMGDLSGEEPMSDADFDWYSRHTSALLYKHYADEAMHSVDAITITR